VQIGPHDLEVATVAVLDCTMELVTVFIDGRIKVNIHVRSIIRFVTWTTTSLHPRFGRQSTRPSVAAHTASWLPFSSTAA